MSQTTITLPNALIEELMSTVEAKKQDRGSDKGY